MCVHEPRLCGAVRGGNASGGWASDLTHRAAAASTASRSRDGLQTGAARLGFAHSVLKGQHAIGWHSHRDDATRRFWAISSNGWRMGASSSSSRALSGRRALRRRQTLASPRHLVIIGLRKNETDAVIRALLLQFAGRQVHCEYRPKAAASSDMSLLGGEINLSGFLAGRADPLRRRVGSRCGRQLDDDAWLMRCGDRMTDTARVRMLPPPAPS